MHRMRARIAIGGVVAFGLVACGARSAKRAIEAGDLASGRAAESGVVGRVTALTAASRSPHAYARRGDLVLEGPGVAVAIAAHADVFGHRPLRGAVVDVGTRAGDAADPMLWWRAGILDGSGPHALVAETVERVACQHGEGV